MRRELGDMATGLKENVRRMLEQSSQVDWDSLGPELGSDQELLLPPTPRYLTSEVSTITTLPPPACCPP